MLANTSFPLLLSKKAERLREFPALEDATFESQKTVQSWGSMDTAPPSSALLSDSRGNRKTLDCLSLTG